MEPIRAQISGFAEPHDSRERVRRKIRLSVPMANSESWTDALIHDLSETGLMIECAIPLEVGELINFNLPGAEAVEARIIWKRDNRHGCEFLAPISKAVVSAALLQASTGSFSALNVPSIDELPVGRHPSLDEVAAWKSQFDQTKSINGYKLIGFRQDSKGFVFAIVTKAN
ncbi:PilZ domain-containing protein [Novosphingobium album (ex Hu et al. 2023)]|uniref:PilZ domain-containing protein n=1 Tax=Novosphingobium album (ex Hu et al. 2023) TaxID=2930093 RepID=A0ABT0B104_9SPHN|nr:PilZ domain-containing protein [Novosphingobium album (ex Hu et al. 2023)]MCJ2178603.1 PilZ domain-containing protein [Novosphingobium album (ex Hu et al. 2023)]